MNRGFDVIQHRVQPRFQLRISIFTGVFQIAQFALNKRLAILGLVDLALAEVVYYVLFSDFNTDIQQAINLGIYQKFQEEEVAFANPTRTITLSDGYHKQERSAVRHGSPLRATMRRVLQDG